MVVNAIFLLVIVAGTVVPGDFFRTEGYRGESYYDHIIDYCLQKMKLVDRDAKVLVEIKVPNYYGFSLPGEGHLVFNGLKSPTPAQYEDIGFRISAKTIGTSEPDLDLLVTLKFDNISGTGNFTGHKKFWNEYNFFGFTATPAEVQVLFMLKKEKESKMPHFAFQFVKPPVYDYPRGSPINIQLLLQENALRAFNHFFAYLHLNISDYLHRPHRNDSNLDNILDNVIYRQSLKPKPLESWFNNKKTIKDRNHTEKVDEAMNVTVYGLQQLKRTSGIEILNGINDDTLDLRFTIKFDNISGTSITSKSIFDKPHATLSRNSLDRSSVNSLNFTAGPTVAEASFYLPRNVSHASYAYKFFDGPWYKFSNEEERKLNIDRRVLRHADSLYGQMLNILLHEMHNQLFS